MKPAAPTNGNEQNAWSFFDAAFCISLASRPDRQQQARAQFEKVGLVDAVEFVTVQKHPTDNELGIFESHLTCIRKGLAAGARTILVFEDDIDFNGFTQDKLREVVAFLKESDRCRLFFLGCLVTKSGRTTRSGILKVAYRSLAHAYIVKRSLAAELVKEEWRRVPFDVMLAGLEEETYAVYPAFAFQSNTPSDNDRHRTLERFRRLFGGLGFIQKMNARYHRHRAAIVLGHLFLLAALAWLCLG